jgi:hypothetical protein
MENPKLALIPSGYKSGTVYSILPTDGVGDFDFSRGSTATRVNKDGLIETVNNNVPRLDWSNSDCPSLLLEPQRTNLVTQSENLSATWLKSGGVTLTSGQISPAGDASAYRVEMTSGASNYLYIGGGIDGVEYTISGYFKADSETNIGFGDGNLAPNSIDLTTEWKRFSFTFTRNGGGLQIDNYFGVSPSQQAKTFYAWGIQMEAGSYATSYIKTTGFTETRLKDFIDGAGSSSLFNSLESTFFVEMASFLNAQTNSNGIELSDISGQNRITLQYDTANNQIRCDVRVLNSAQAIITTQSFDITNFNKMAITYKLNEVKFYVNGQLISTDTSVNTFAPDTLTEVRSTIADISSDAFNLQAKIKDLRVYNRVLTQAEAIELTTL